MIKRDLVAPPAKMRFSPWRLGVLAIFVVYALGLKLEYYGEGWLFYEGIILWVHEAGHFFFMFFGNDFLTIAGGTIMQILVPIVFITYFYRTGQEFSAALTCSWLAESIIGVAIYMGDAIDGELPLIGGGGLEGHDWHNMLSMLGILEMAPVLSKFTQALAIAVICVGILWGFKASRVAVKEDRMPDMLFD